MDVVTFLVISLLSTTALLGVKTVQELAGHFGGMFSMYEHEYGIFYGTLLDISMFFPLMLLFDYLAITMIPFFVSLTMISFVWLYCIVVYVISIFGMYADLKGCKEDRWYVGDYPIPMMYFNWIIDFWVNGAVLLYLIGEGWVLFNVIMACTFILIAILSLILKKTGKDVKLREKISCPIREW